MLRWTVSFKLAFTVTRSVELAKKEKTQRTRTQRDENSQTNSASFYSKVSRALMAALALAFRSPSLFQTFSLPLSISLTTFGKTAGATKTQRQRNSAAGRELSTQKWQKQSGKRVGGHGQPPWAFAALFFSLSALPPTLSRCAAHAPKLSFKARERTLRWCGCAFG